MKKNLSVILGMFFVFSSLFFIGCENTGESPWTTNWEQAVTKANESRQNILLFFSTLEGEEENPAVFLSQNLNNAFSKSYFRKKVAKNYVLMNINFNSNKEEVDYEQLTNASSLVNKYAIQSLPTILLVTPEGYVIASITGEKIEEKPSKIIKNLASSNGKSKKVTKLRAELSEEIEIKKLFIIDKLISNLDPDYQYLLVELISEIKLSDPDNESGLLNKYIMNFAYIEALDAFNRGDAQEAIDVFIRAAEDENIIAKDKQEAYQTAAYLLANTGLGTKQLVIEYLEKAKDANPKSDQVKVIQETIDYIKSVSESENNSLNDSLNKTEALAAEDE
ncbi:MAG: hypothetical protein ACTTHG_01680 [Treponemataceae bacterium]